MDEGRYKRPTFKVPKQRRQTAITKHTHRPKRTRLQTCPTKANKVNNPPFSPSKSHQKNLTPPLPPTVDLGSLTVQQLSQVKKQLDDEVQHLTSSYSQLRAAQQKFRDCIASVRAGVANSTADKPLLVPLTSSLYVPGTLASTETVLVDVGTGFFVEKTTEQAKTFYEAKVAELGKNVKDLETIVNNKGQNLRVVEEGGFLLSSVLEGVWMVFADFLWYSDAAEGFGE